MANLVVLLAYVVLMAGIGIYLSRYVKKEDDFFLAGRSLNRWIIAGTIMATNVDAIFLVGPAAAAFAGGGVSVLLIAWTGNMIAAFSALFFVPRFRRIGITTVSEFLDQRYSLWLRLLTAVAWTLYYALFAGTAVYTLSVALEPVLNVPVNTLILIIGGVVILYCAFSGLVSVAYTAIIQSFLMILGGLILLPLSLKAVGGWTSFVEQVPADYFVFWKSGDVWPNYKDIIMFTLLGLPYWCTSQYMLQRTFAGKTVEESSRGITLAALLTGPLTLSYILPGICGVLLFQGANALSSNDRVLPEMIVRFMPAGLGGLFIAGLVAASNSTASSLLNSIATLVDHDFFRRFVPNKSPRFYIWVGRIATVIGGLIGLSFAMQVADIGIIQAVYQVMGFFEPPIFVLVACALFWKFANVWGAFAGLTIGFLFNLIAFRYGMHAADMAIIDFPLCLVSVILGSLIGKTFSPATKESQQKVEELLARTRGGIRKDSPIAAKIGAGWAIASLAAFILCAFFERYLPKPESIFIFMGLMMSFVFGCYKAIPLFVYGEEDETGATERTLIEGTWIHRFFGNGYTWLGLYVLAIALVFILYFI